MLWFTLVVVLLIYIALKLYNNVNYWKHKGITHIRSWPLLGSAFERPFTRTSMPEGQQYLYNKYPEAKFVGLHNFTIPVLMVRDPEMIKQITVKSFDSFTDHTIIVTEDMEPFLGNNIFSLKDQKWREMRSTLSPAFTSSKMRQMYKLIKDCAEQFTQHFLQCEKKEGILQLEMKDIFTKYTNDNIATCAFGITCNSIKDENNEFYIIGKTILNFNIITVFKFVTFLVMPKISKAIKLQLFSKKIINFFRKIIISTIEFREKNNIIRPDMIHLLMEARKGQLKHEMEKDEDAGFATVEESQLGKEKTTKAVLTDDVITAQAFLFFLAGYDTVSTSMCFMAHELAINPDIQQKLHEEIDSVLLKCNGHVDYDSLLKMKYLDMVVSESLRKWPPAVMAERKCTTPYTLVDGNQSVTVEKDQSVLMPIYSIHRDEKNYNNPDKFDPERFNDENKVNILPFTYLPFGSGPRSCIGCRMALLEIKTLFVTLLSKFDIVVIEKTQIPLKLKKSPLVITAEKGFWLGLKRRN